jgi:uncharacterized protein (DUF488 family)
MHVFTIGHGVRPVKELVEILKGVGVGTLVDVPRIPPQPAVQPGSPS